MKILLLSIGTRGDCEPFLGVGEMLRKYGEDVVCAFPEQYRNLAEDSGFRFCSLGSGFIDLLDSQDGRNAISGKGLQKFTATMRTAKASVPIQKDIIRKQHVIIATENPDIIIFHPKAVYPVPYHLKTDKKVIILGTVPQMLHEVKGKPHIGLDKLPPKLSYEIANFGFAQSVMFAVRMFFKSEFRRRQIQEELLRLPIFYTVSPHIFPRPAYWNDNVIVAGFLERNKTVNWKPDYELNAFIERHEKLLFITFGSMTNSNPQEKAKIMVDVLKELKIPAILNSSGGGLVEPESYDKDFIHFVKSIPYDWAFPKMYATVHHGGAGTTQSSLKAGCATMAIPHVGDQPMWNKRIAELGAGPKGMPIEKMNKQNLKEKLWDLYNNPQYKENAVNLGERMRAEDYSEMLYEFIVGQHEKYTTLPR